MSYEIKVVHTVEYVVIVSDELLLPGEAAEEAIQDLIHSGELSRKERETGVESWRISGSRMV
jgi:hypothetical protein